MKKSRARDAKQKAEKLKLAATKLRTLKPKQAAAAAGGNFRCANTHG